MDKKTKRGEKWRHGVQALWTVLTNSFLIGFVKGKIYTGPLKNLCVPGLNCYSCPGALGSCPIGALQSVLGSKNYKVSFYVVGFLIFVGALCGRFVCGWLCPFGFIQDLIHKIPFPKKLKTFRGDRLLRKLKYVVLLLFVILLPMFAVDQFGISDPWFCKYICPAGTLEGGLPLVLLNQALRSTVGWLYAWKNVLLLLTVLLSVIIYRPFCKYLCPLGGIYALFNKVSVFSLRFQEEKCVHCGKCADICKMNVDPAANPCDSECIRCGLCVDACPVSALELANNLKKKQKD